MLRRHRRVPTSVRRLLIAAAATVAAAGCSTDRSAATDSTAALRRAVALERHDSMVAVAIATLDSPEITLEWLDSPRRRVTARARRVRAAAAHTTVARSDSATATSAEASSSSQHSERSRGPRLPGGWVVAAGAALMLALSWRGKCARR